MQNTLEGVRKLVSLYRQRHSEVCFSPGHPTRKQISEALVTGVVITQKCWLLMQQELVYVLKTPVSSHWIRLIAVLPKSLQKIKDLIGASFHTRHSY